MTLLDISHLDQIGVCLDLGHAHMSSGVAEAIGVLGPRIAQVHVHDNHGLKDEHLWPGDGTIEWPATIGALKDLSSEPAAVLEIGFDLEANPTAIPERIQRSFQMLA
jgi:sugar phosphate isomerase/epimerase